MATTTINHDPEGKSLIFTWGPPWRWLPDFQKHILGWSLIWLWFGVHYIRRSGHELIDDSESWREQSKYIGVCNWCPQRLTKENSVIAGDENEHYRVCKECIEECEKMKGDDVPF